MKVRGEWFVSAGLREAQKCSTEVQAREQGAETKVENVFFFLAYSVVDLYMFRGRKQWRQKARYQPFYMLICLTGSVSLTV